LEAFSTKNDSLSLGKVLFIAGGWALPFGQMHSFKKNIKPSLKKPQLNITAPLIVTGAGLLFKSSSMYRNQSDWHSREVRSFTTQADDFLTFVPNAAVYGLDAAGIKAKNNFIDRTIATTLANSGMFAGVYGLKYISNVQRPDKSDRLSFPSAHAGFAFTGAQILHEEYGHKSVFYSIAGYSVAGATGILRMINNKHWFSDVVFGAGIGMLSTKIAYHVLPKIQKNRAKRKLLKK
jgi:membrane-associated phospholipid phosphatase